MAESTPAGQPTAIPWPEKPPIGWPPDWPWPPPVPGTPQVAFSPGFYAALFAACVAALMAMGVPQGEAIAQCLKRFIPGGAGAAGEGGKPPCWPPGLPWPFPGVPGQVQPQGAGGNAKIRIQNDIISELEEANKHKDKAIEKRKQAGPPPHGALGLTADDVKRLLEEAAKEEAAAHDIEMQVAGKKKALSLLD